MTPLKIRDMAPTQCANKKCVSPCGYFNVPTKAGTNGQAIQTLDNTTSNHTSTVPALPIFPPHMGRGKFT